MLMFFVIFDIVRIDSFDDLFCGRDCFGWSDIFFCDVKASPVTTYMRNDCSHDCC